MRIRKTLRRTLFASTLALLQGLVPTVSLRAGESVNTSGPVAQGTSNGNPTDYKNNLPAVTISLTGQTALRNFTSSPGATTLAPGSSATFYFGPSGKPVTYYAPRDPNAYVQLAKKDFTTPDVGLGATGIGNAPSQQQHSALRIEWHEQGSVQGLVDLVNDQVGFTTGPNGTGTLSVVPSRGPSTSNPTWVNGNSFTTGGTLSGHLLVDGNYGDTYDRLVYDRVTGTNKIGIQYGGQNRAQASIGEYKTENFSKEGTPGVGRLPGEAGFGQGNPALPFGPTRLGLGVASSRQAFLPEAVANQSLDKVNPESPTDEKYAQGPWNSAGANNISSKQYAVTAVTYAANPGTGLYRINKGDAQWLLTTGRLRNGADFNVAMRANDAGQRTVPSVNVGVDPSWAVGENDGGSTSGSAAANAQRTVGPELRFSGKTSGTASRDVIAQSRLGFGPLSIAETRGAAETAPVRALDVDFENLEDSGNPADFKRVTFDNVANFSYKAVLVSHYNTVKAQNLPLLQDYRTTFQAGNGRLPTPQEEQAWWNALESDVTGVKGDQYGNVASFINNVAQSTGTGKPGLTPAIANNPADALFASGYLIPQLLDYSREYDGASLVPKPLTEEQKQVRENVKANYGANFTADGSFGSNATTIGNNAYYTSRNAGTTLLLNGPNSAVAITAKDAAGNPVPNGVPAPRGNYLFGNFNQNGTRDFASVKESVNAALSLFRADRAENSVYQNEEKPGVSNGTVITPLSGSPGWASTANTKGDLIILGDFNTDGAFNGRDLYLLARGASLSDNAGTDQLTTASGVTFADQVRNPNAKLNKNAALDFISAQLNNPADPGHAFLRRTASADTKNDPTGALAFQKFDVNRDGLLNRTDALVVHEFIGSDYRNLQDQLSAVVTNSGAPLYEDPTVSIQPRKSISLVDVELTDDGLIDFSDLQLIANAPGAGQQKLLLLGDADLDDNVDLDDLSLFGSNYTKQHEYRKWQYADFNGDTVTDQVDFGIWATSYPATITESLLVPYVGAESASTLYAYYQSLTNVLLGDYNKNGLLDAADLDLQTLAFGSQDLSYDLTKDGVVDYSDRLNWVNVVKKTWIGDANLDGFFDSGDFVAVFTVGKFEKDIEALWGEGDWNGDLRFDSGDFVAAFQEGGYERGGRAAVAAVPEPSSWSLMFSLSSGVLLMLRRRGTTVRDEVR